MTGVEALPMLAMTLSAAETTSVVAAGSSAFATAGALSIAAPTIATTAATTAWWALPAWLGTAATVAGSLASVASAAGSLSQGRSQAAIHGYNANVSRQPAAAVQRQTDYAVQQNRAQADRLAGRQRVLIAKSGVDLDGSPLQVMEDTASQVQRDALAIRYAGDVRSAQAESQAALDGMQADSSLTAGYMGAGASVLSGASQLGRAYTRVSQDLYP